MGCTGLLESQTDDTVRCASGKKKRCKRKPRTHRLRQLLVTVVIVGVVAGGLTWIAYYRVFKAGFAEVVPGQVYRSGQPSHDELLERIDKTGIRTIISLRGETVAEVRAERQLAAERGVAFISFRLSAGHLPTRKQLLDLIAALEQSSRPILMHCNEGVDRTGMAAAVASLVVGRVGLERGIGQLPWLRTNPGRNHISDLLGQYKVFCDQAGADRDDPAVFKQWARETYTAQPVADTQLVPRIPCWPGKDNE